MAKKPVDIAANGGTTGAASGIGVGSVPVTIARIAMARIAAAANTTMSGGWSAGASSFASLRDQTETYSG